MLATSRLIPTDTGPSAKKRGSQNLAHSSLTLSAQEDWLQNLPQYDPLFSKCLVAFFKEKYFSNIDYEGILTIS